MKNIKLFTLALAILLAACSNPPKHEIHVPNNSSIVGVINTSQIVQKVAWDALFSNDLFEKMGKKGKKMEESMGNLGESGIDFMENIYFFKTEELKDESFALLLNLKDESQLEAMLSKEEARVNEVDGVKHAYINGVNYSFSNGVLLMIMSNGNSNYDNYAAKVLNTDYSSDQTKAIKETLAKNNDVVYCMDMGAFLPQQVNDLGIESEMFDIQKTKDDLLFASIDFEDGSILANMTYEYGEEMAKEVAKYSKDNKVGDLLNKAASENVIATTGFSFDLKSIVKRLEEQKLTIQPDKMLAPYNTSVNDIANLLSGDFFVYLSDIQMETSVQSNMRYDYEMEDYVMNKDTVTSPIAHSTLMLGIADQSRAQELIQQFSLFMQKEDGYYSVKLNEGIYLDLEDGALIISNDENAIKGIQKKSGLKINSEVERIAKKGPVHAWADMKKVSEGYNNIVPNEEKIFGVLYNNLDQFLFESESNSDNFKYDVNLKFADPSKNSLLQLIEMASEPEFQEAI